MEIKGKVYCLFEQTGIFKNAFKRRGIAAKDIDIESFLGETDWIFDIYDQIDFYGIREYSIFDHFTPDDLLIAFFPYDYFCAISQCQYRIRSGLLDPKKMDQIIHKTENYIRLLKLYKICLEKNLRLIVDKPKTYRFLNCSPLQNDKVKRKPIEPLWEIYKLDQSEITPEYADTFITDFILGA